MEEEDEVTFACSTTWNAVEGFLERSVCIAKENEEVGTPGQTSRLVMVPQAGESGPCELTVTFQRRLCHVRQIYVLSSARTVEIYGQLEQDSEAEYISTVRGELVCLPEDEVFKEGRENGQRRFSDSEKSSGEIGARQSAPLASSEEIKSKSVKGDAQDGIPLKVDTEEFVGEWKGQLLNSSGPPWGRSRDSEEESFQSLSDGVPGKMVEGSIIFDESLDQTDWVECPHSPMKSSALSSDDEVDINKCGFFLVDSDGEAQRTEHFRISLFAESISVSLDHRLRSPSEPGDRQAGQHGSIQFSAGNEEAAVGKRDATCGYNGGSKTEQEWAEGQSAEERSQPPTPSSPLVVIDSAVPRGKRSEPRDIPGVQSPSPGTPHDDLEASRKACFTRVEDHTGEIPVYKAEVNLACSDAWRSVKIRFLSLKDKSKVILYNVVVTSVPGPSITPSTERADPFGSFQLSSGSSSLLAMIAPSILQTARRLAESRKVNLSGLMSYESEMPESKVSPCPDSPNGFLSVLCPGLPSPQPAPSGTSSFAGSVTQWKYDARLGEEKSDSPLGEESCSTVSQSIQDERCRTVIGLGTDTCAPVIHKWESLVHFDQSEVMESTDKKNFQSEKVDDGGHEKDDDLSREVFQRLDRLEAICLRMENSLNVALATMDERLKLLEVGAVGRMPVTGQPFWGSSYESGPFVSATSVNLPPVQAGIKTGSVLDKQTHICTSAPVDSHGGQRSTKGVTSRTDSFYPSLLSSTSPSLLSSVSPALPLWPLSSPKQLSPQSSSRASSTATSTHKDGHVDLVIGSCDGQAAQVKAEETYWEPQTSDDTESDMSSDSEHTSYADNSEDPGPSSCPESVSSSPSKPAQRVESALAAVLSALSASFDAPFVNSPKQMDSFQREDEDSAEEDSFTSEEQAPLVDIDCFLIGVQDKTTQAKTEEVRVRGYEPIPISGEKVLCDMGEQEDVFWASDVEGPDKGSQIDWQDGILQSQDEKVFPPHEDSDKRVEKSSTVSEAKPDHLVDTYNVLRMDDLTTYDLFPTDFERILREEPRTESKGRERSEAFEHLKLPNPFLQGLPFAGDGDIVAREDSWCEDWNDKQLESGGKVTLTYMTVRGFARPLDPHKQMLVQEEMFPEDWKWFTSEVPPSSKEGDLPDSLVGNGGFKLGAKMATLVDPSKAENEIQELSFGNNEPRSLLDEDTALVGVDNQFRVDVYSQDWIGQKTQWSLLDEDPPIASNVDFRSEEDRPDDWFRQREQRSLLDEDIFIPPPSITTGEREGSVSSACISPEEQYDLSGVIREEKGTDNERSPSSLTSRLNPFEDDCSERSDLKLGNQNLPSRDLLEDFCEEVHEFEAPESERTQTLLFHLSL